MKIFKRLSIVMTILIIICLLSSISVFAADNIFSTSGEVDPEKDVYYVGDTVNISDYFRNGDAGNATNVTVEYYHRIDGSSSVYSGSPINYGTVPGGTSEHHTFNYTFKETDIGEYRIGSKITYNHGGGGPYNEYSTGHNFIVELAPTPSPTPEITPTATPTTATPTPVPTDTPEPTATPTEEVTVVATLANDITSEGTSSNETEGKISDSTLLIVLIAVLELLVISLTVLITVLAMKKKR